MTTPTLMTAAEMRAYLIEKRRLQVEEAETFAKRAEERRKVWAAEQLAPMLETIMQGAHEESRVCDEKRDAAAVVDLARSLGYEANVEMDDREDEVFYAVVKAPELEVASEKPRTEPGDEDWLNGATGRVRS